MIFEEPSKNLSLIEDKDGLFKKKMASIAEKKGYIVRRFEKSSYTPILNWVNTKVEKNQLVFILH